MPRIRQTRFAEPSHDHVTNAKRRPTRRGDSLRDDRTSSAELRQRASMMDSSPRALAQRRTRASIASSGRADAFRLRTPSHRSLPIQRVIQLASLVNDKLNIAGEDHDESSPRRHLERQVAAHKTGSNNYWQESQFARTAESRQPADPYELRYEQLLQVGLSLQIDAMAAMGKTGFRQALSSGDADVLTNLETALKTFDAEDLETYGQKIDESGPRTARAFWIGGLHRVVLFQCRRATHIVGELRRECKGKNDLGEYFDGAKMERLVNESGPLDRALSEIITGLIQLHAALLKARTDFNLAARNISSERSAAMHQAGQAQSATKGLWKVGDAHANHMLAMDGRKYNLLTKDDFNAELKRG